MNYQHDGESYAVSLTPQPDGSSRAFIGEHELVFTARAVDGGWLVTLEGRQYLVYAAARGNERFIAFDGQHYTLTAAEARRRSGGAGAGDLTAQMPGQVREIFVQPGDPVGRGQALLLLEAMKMEIRVAAPADGRVSRVLVAVGDVVDRGQPLVELLGID